MWFSSSVFVELYNSSLLPLQVLIVVSPAVEVCRPSCQQDVVGMPVQTHDCGANGLLDVLTQPPVGRDTGINLNFSPSEEKIHQKSSPLVSCCLAICV